MQNDYKGYSNFNDVDNVGLRTYNRFVTVANINHTHGAKMVREYVEQFSEGEQLQLQILGKYIQARGAEAVLKEIQQGVGVISE
jgi:ferritin